LIFNTSAKAVEFLFCISRRCLERAAQEKLSPSECAYILNVYSTPNFIMGGTRAPTTDVQPIAAYGSEAAHAHDDGSNTADMPLQSCAQTARIALCLEVRATIDIAFALLFVRFMFCSLRQRHVCDRDKEIVLAG
jgi:hypothetical protein